MQNDSDVAAISACPHGAMFGAGWLLCLIQVSPCRGGLSRAANTRLKQSEIEVGKVALPPHRSDTPRDNPDKKPQARVVACLISRFPSASGISILLLMPSWDRAFSRRAAGAYLQGAAFMCRIALAALSTDEQIVAPS